MTSLIRTLSKPVITHVILSTLLLFCSSALAGDLGPLSQKGEKQFGLNIGYGYSFGSNRDVRFAGLHPYFGKVLTDPVGKGWYRGTVEGIVEGAFNFVFKNQHKYAGDGNAFLRYNFIPGSEKLRPYVQGGFGLMLTNLDMHGFGSKLNFVSNTACGPAIFFQPYKFLQLGMAGILCVQCGS